ncbi:MAG: hypothetical protein JKY75_05705 [Erythrobacter sp.]|jgi:hypothetical protein|nr:hypothetical protein [Erythrobacter sp.]
MAQENNKGSVYQRQVDKSKSQILFRNVEPKLVKDLDQVCKERGITRKVAFIEMCSTFIFGHRYHPHEEKVL